MTCRLAPCLGALLLALPFLAAADQPGPDQPEPPLRLKKKHRPVDAAADKKPDAKNEQDKEGSARKPKAGDKDKVREPQTGRKLRLPEDDEQPRKDAAKEAQEALAQAAKEMRESRERLARKDTGEGTQEIQRDILKRLETLLKQQQQQDQQQQSQSSSSSSRRQQDARSRGQQRNAGQRQQTVQQRRQGQANQPQQTQADSAGRGTGRDAKERMSKIADLYKDVWGSLPETLRQEMDQYSRERFMPKYDDLLKQYYARVAEKGRRKGQ
jgi:hypothetical protein